MFHKFYRYFLILSCVVFSGCTAVCLLLGSWGISDVDKDSSIISPIDVDIDSLWFVAIEVLEKISAENICKDKEHFRIEAVVKDTVVKIQMSSQGEDRTVYKVTAYKHSNPQIKDTQLAYEISCKIYKKAKKIWEW